MVKLFVAVSALVSLVGLSACQTVSYPPVVKLTQGQLGLIGFKSANFLDYKAVLSRVSEEQNVFGRLTFPKEGLKKPVPAMVLVHGSGGIHNGLNAWAKHLRNMGVATFMINSFVTRGITSTVGSQFQVSEASMTADAFSALDLLATHPGIDKNKIGIMGWSKGGQPALYSAWKPVEESLAKNGNRFALHVSFYPWCLKLEEPRLSNKPIYLLVGENDNWTGAKPCEEVIQGFKSAGANATVLVYPKAPHGFDSTSRRTVVDDAHSISECRFTIRRNGEHVEDKTGLTFHGILSALAAVGHCYTVGTTAGQDKSARTKAYEDVAQIVRKHLL